MVSSDFVNFCERLNKSNIDLFDFNAITEKYGLAFPILFKTLDDFNNAVKKLSKPKSNSLKDVENNKQNKKGNEEDNSDVDLNNRYEQKVPSSILYLQHTLNSKSKFYINLSKTVDIVPLETPEFKNIFIVPKDNNLEAIGA